MCDFINDMCECVSQVCVDGEFIIVVIFESCVVMIDMKFNVFGFSVFIIFDIQVVDVVDIVLFLLVGFNFNSLL